MAIITVLLAMFLLGSMGVSMVSVTGADVESQADDLTSQQAANVAEGGIQYILMSQFNGDSDFSDNVSPTGTPYGGTPVTLSPGQFWVEYSNQSTTAATIKVTAKVGDAVRTVTQSVGQEGSGYSYVTMVNGNINMTSSSGDVYGDAGLHGNANIGASVTVHGNITKDLSLAVPSLSFSPYQAMCTTTHIGNLTITGSYTGNRCVTGNVTITAGATVNGVMYTSGNVTFAGNNATINGTVVAEGNITGDNRTGLKFLSVALDATTHMPALAAHGNVNLQNADGLKVSGAVWNSGNLNFSNTDNLDFTGSFMGGGNFNMNSATNLSVQFSSDLLVGVPGMSGVGSSSTSLSLSGWKSY